MHLFTGAIYDFDLLLYCINNAVDQNTSRFWVGDWFSKLRFLAEAHVGSYASNMWGSHYFSNSNNIVLEFYFCEI